jgi:hypothetical protein
MGKPSVSVATEPTIKARFVGGCLHNQILRVRRLIHVDHIPPQPINFDFSLAPESIPVEHYQLYLFVSENGAKFVQYIHESLIASDGSIDPRAFIEAKLPTMPDRITRKFDKRMAALYRHRRLTFKTRSP